jgi:excisionase family DNA binding protein
MEGASAGEVVLTLTEAAKIIRCSKAHLLNVIHGRVPNVPPLPCARIGRRILVRREALERWLLAVEMPLRIMA